MTPPWESPPAARVPTRLQSCVLSMAGYAAGGVSPAVHRGLPSSSLTMVFSLDAPLRTASTWRDWTAGDLDSQWTVLGGLQTSSALIEQAGQWRGVQLALHPLGARRLFGVPASALSGDTWDARDLLGPELDAVHDRLASASSWLDRYRIIADFLLARLDRMDTRPPRAEVAETWRLLHEGQGRARIGALGEHVGYSRRRLTQLFSAEVGLAPKTAARVMRFDTARRALGARATVGGVVVAGAGAGAGLRRAPGRSHLDLSDLALECGYYDHAHLVRDFTEFAGLSPTAWLSEEFPNIQATSGHARP